VTQADQITGEASATPVILRGRYRLERRLATGGMAEVWQAIDLRLERPVAVKLLKTALLDEPRAVERFHREAVAAARLSHPNVVPVFDVIDDAPQPGIVMELIRGVSLRDQLDQHKRLPVDIALIIVASIAKALDAAHRAGIVHRDIKPANILLAPDGRVLLADFGIAKRDADSLEQRASSDLTRDDTMVGTAKYLSPEQVRGLALDGRSDLYALGSVAYEMLAGQAPFEADTDVATALARLTAEPDDLRSLRHDVPEPLARLIHSLLARDPELRPATAGGVVLALSALTGERPLAPVRPLPAAPARPASSPATSPTSHRTAPLTQRLPQRLTRVIETAGPEQRRIAWVVLGLVVAGLVAAAVAFTRTEPGVEAMRSLTPASDIVAVTSIRAFDPVPGDGAENTDQLTFLTDGNPVTAWTTERYPSPTFGAKLGVGLVVDLSRPAARRLSVLTPTEGWSAQVYIGDGSASTLTGWGPSVAAIEGRSGAITVDLPEAKSVLLWITRLGEGAGGTHQVAITELRLSDG
jgi:eukaryotic-like serine/threonine-protein kinase